MIGAAINTGKPCKYPYEARAPMEAHVIDVYQRVTDVGFGLEVVTMEDSCCTYTGSIIVE